MASPPLLKSGSVRGLELGELGDDGALPAAAASGSESAAGAAKPAAAGAEGFGLKHIGTFSSICLLVNNITGPGMVQIPSLFQQAGWLFPTVTFIFTGLLIGLVGMYLSKAIASLPGNKGLSKRVEFNELAKAVFPRWLYILTLVVLIFNFQATNISSIIVSAQTMDNTLLATAKKTCAIYVYPAQAPGCIGNDDVAGAVVTDSPFGDTHVISLGYLVTLCLTIPLGFINLEDNMWVQQGGFLLLLFCLLAWFVQFFYSGDLGTANMPAVAVAGWGPVLANVIFNFGYITTLPSWLNEKAPGVSIAKTSWVSVIISGVMFLLLGLLGGFSSLNFQGNANLLAIMNDPTNPTILAVSKVACYIFPIAALLSGIPIFSIIIRYNLLNEGVPKLWANLFAVVFPWALALVFYSGNLLAELITWSSAILFVLINFVLPLSMYLTITETPYLFACCIRGRQAGGGGAGTADSINADGAGADASVALLSRENKPAAAKAYNSTTTFVVAAGPGAAGAASEKLLEGTDAPATEEAVPDEVINELPFGLAKRCVPTDSARVLFWISAALALITFVVQTYTTASTPAAGGD